MAVALTYRREGTLSPEQRVELFCERVGDYRAEVLRTRDIAGAVESVGVQQLLAPAGLPREWLPASVARVDDEGLTPHELDEVDGVLTGCTVAIAETGTVVLTAGPAEGRRALTLVPDLHVVVVREEQVVELVPEAMRVVADLVRRETRPVTFVSGPSATSDIELDRVEGVHGPRRLVVIVA